MHTYHMVPSQCSSISLSGVPSPSVAQLHLLPTSTAPVPDLHHGNYRSQIRMTVPLLLLLQDCQGMQSCFQVCQQKCPTAPPPGPTVNGQLCESYGSLASGTEAQKACDLTMVSGHCHVNQHSMAQHGIPPACW